MPSLFPSEASVSPSPFSYSPVDNSSIFKTLAERASEAVTGVTAQQEKLRSQLDELDAAPNGNGSIGATLFGGLVGALAGGSASQIAQSAGAVGQAHVNNLEANAKEKKLRLITQLSELEKRRTDAIGQAQAVEIAGLNSQVQDQRDLSQGKVVGSPEWEREKANRRQEIGLATAGRASNKTPASAEQLSAAKSALRSYGVPEDQWSFLDGVASEDLPRRVQELRLGKKESTLQDGGYNKSITDTSLNIIESAAKTSDAIAPVMDKLKKYESRLGDGSAAGKFTIYGIEKAIPTTEGQLLSQELKNLAYQVVVAAQGRGASDAETELLKDFLAGNAALSVGELDDRIQRLARNNATAARTRLESLKTDPHYSDQAMELETKYGKFLPSFDSIKQIDGVGVGNGAPKVEDYASFSEYLAAKKSYAAKGNK